MLSRVFDPPPPPREFPPLKAPGGGLPQLPHHGPGSCKQRGGWGVGGWGGCFPVFSPPPPPTGNEPV